MSAQSRWLSAPARWRADAERRRWVTPEELNVAPSLLGQALARPSRRLYAMAADLAAIGIVSSWANAWMLVACMLGLAERTRARRHGPSMARTGITWLLVALLMGVGVREAFQAPHERPGHPLSAGSRDDEGDAGDEGDAADDAAVAALLDTAASAVARAASVPVAASAPADPASTAQTVDALRQRVRELEIQVLKERARAKQQIESQDWHERLRRLGLDFGISYGWALVYFTMLPTWWRGQTLGKRLFGLRVVEITGKPMTPVLNFRRFGGYLAGMATGGLGFLQLLWDPNRQTLEDKAAHTVVVDERQPRRAPSADPDAASPPADPT